MPHQRRGHRVEPVEILRQIGGRQGRDRTAFGSDFVLALQSSAIPPTIAHRPMQRQQQDAGGDHDLALKRLRAENDHD